MRPLVDIRIISILIWLLLLAFASGSSTPLFPSPLEIGLDHNSQLHIASTFIDPSKGVIQLDEFIEISTGKLAYQLRSPSKSWTLFYDHELAFFYWPYDCQVIDHDSITGLPEAQEIMFVDEKMSRYLNDKMVEIRLLGIAAIWIKAVKESNCIYNLQERGHSWSFNIDNRRVEFFFSGLDQDNLQLESIELYDQEGKQRQSIKIISLSNKLPTNTQEKLFRPPVGFGCHTERNTIKEAAKDPAVQHLRNIGLGSKRYLHELELTLMDELGQAYMSNVRYFDCDTRILRLQDSTHDLSLILDSDSGIRYSLDSRSATCKPEPLADLDEDWTLIQWSPSLNLRLQLTESMLLKILYKREGFELIRIDQGDSSESDTRYLTFERTLKPEESSPFFGRGGLIRLARTYVRTDSKYQLVSAMLWQLNPDKAGQILRSLRVHVLERRPVESEVETAKLTDISQLCYIQNEQMLEGRDYAWLEFTFDLTARLLDQVKRTYRHQDLEDHLYRQLKIELKLDQQRISQMNLHFDGTKMFIHLLLLDVPSLTILFTNIRFQKLETSIEGSKDMNFYDELAPDLDHCERLCRIHNCGSMSFCKGKHFCRISTHSGKEAQSKLVADYSCDTYIRPAKLKANPIGLKHRLANWQHADFSVLNLPERPEELAMDFEESGLGVIELHRLEEEYLISVRSYLSKMEHDLQSSFFILKLYLEPGFRIHMIHPSQVIFKHDPLQVLGLQTAGELVDELQASFLLDFKTSLSGTKFKRPELLASSRWQAYRLSYDQCALSCVDLNCNSFSHCNIAQECILTDVKKIDSPDSILNLTEPDTDCHIVRRDFLSKFSKFTRVKRPTDAKILIEGTSPIECAQSCMMEQQYVCLAFDYCIDDGGASCYLLDQREIVTGPITSTASIDSKNSGTWTGCDHYSRSYLADFIQLDFRRFKSLAQFDTNQLKDLSLEECAEECLTKSQSCSAFQFCISYSQKDALSRSCILIESRVLAAPLPVPKLVIDELTGETKGDIDLFLADDLCHIFSLRQSSSQSQIRNLALNSMTAREEYNRNQMKRVDRDTLTTTVEFILVFVSTLIVGLFSRRTVARVMARP